MVKLKVIRGGKPQLPACIPKVKLFSAYSLVDNFHGHDMVKLHWIYLGRKKPIASFERLIGDYKHTDERVRPFLESYVMELFAGEEADTLRSCLMQHGLELHVEEERLPVSGGLTPMPYRQAPVSAGRGFHYLPESDRGILPFEVCAYYDVSFCPPSLQLQGAQRERGTVYLEEAFKLLGLPGDVGTERLEAAVEALFDHLGLFVASGLNRQERLERREEFLRRKGPPHTTG